MNGTLYLLCFAPGVPRDARGASSHYLGWTAGTPEDRAAQHIAGTGSPLVAAAVRLGLDVHLVRTWPNADRHDERSLKNRRNVASFCPACHGTELAARRGLLAPRRARRAAA